MSAKLSRIEEQERAFLEKYGKKEPNKEPMRPVSGASLQKGTKNRQDITPQDISRKKKKKAANYEENSEESQNGYEEHEKDTRTVANEELIDTLSELRELEHCHFTERELKSKKKKKKVVSESNEADPEPTIRSSKKKKQRLEERDEVREEELNGHHEWVPSEDPRVSKKKKKSRRGLKERVEEQESSMEEHTQSEKKQKQINEDMSMEEGCQSTKKKKKRKSRDCSDEEQLSVDSTEHRIKSKKKRKH